MLAKTVTGRLEELMTILEHLDLDNVLRPEPANMFQNTDTSLSVVFHQSKVRIYMR